MEVRFVQTSLDDCDKEPKDKCDCNYNSIVIVVIC